MKLILPIVFSLSLALIEPGAAQIVYFNDFSSPDSIQDFTIIGESFVGYKPPPLHTVTIQNEQLRIETTVSWPHGQGNPPVLIGSALLVRGNSDFGSGFSDILSQNTRTISWTFNVARQNGPFSDVFDFILGSTIENPSSTAAKGYYFKGGGMVGNRMVLSRFDYGIGGGQETVIDIADGLGPFPQMGSFKITFDPLTHVWRLFGVMDYAFENPMLVSTLLGSGVDSTYVNRALPYFGFGGTGTGVAIFDNVGVTIIPEPSSILLVLAGSALGTLRIRRKKSVRPNA